MAVDDAAIILTAFVQMELPGGNVNLCDGGFLDFDAGNGVERFRSQHSTYGTLSSVDSVQQGFGALAETGTITLSPNPDAAVTDWFSDELADCRVRFWFGEIAADYKTVTSAEQLGDFLVDYAARVIAPDGGQALELNLMSRDQRLFLTNEGNVCSQRSHQRFWPGENGFNNCTDVRIPIAWGTAAPPGGISRRASFGGGRKGVDQAQYFEY